MENSLTIILFAISAILMIGGLLIFFAPKFLIRISEPLNKEFGAKRKSKTFIIADEKIFLNRRIFGPVLIIIGLILLYFAFYLI
ncbi:MAG: hypothetical protein V3W20_06280 [Candidatus Neomarinimicrobiota bacterium]